MTKLKSVDGHVDIRCLVVAVLVQAQHNATHTAEQLRTHDVSAGFCKTDIDPIYDGSMMVNWYR